MSSRLSRRGRSWAGRAGCSNPDAYKQRHSGIAQWARPGTHEHGPTTSGPDRRRLFMSVRVHGFRVPRYARPRNDRLNCVDRDLFDPPFGEPPDDVLRHRQAHHNRARQAGVKPAQHAGDDAMRDGDYPPLAVFGKPGGDAAAKCLVGLTTRTVELPFARTIPIEHARRTVLDLITAELIPSANRYFLEPVVEGNRRDVAARRLDQLGGTAGATKRAGDDRHALRLW